MGGEAPADLGEVRYAFRLGWAIAETRGRYRPDRFDARDPGHPGVFQRNGWGLPLANERSPAEIRRELIDTVEDLSVAIKLDDEASKDRWATLKSSLGDMERADADRRAEWPNVARKFYELDAHTQDTLVLNAAVAAAYQLGRGLAETYWALEPNASDGDMGSWRFVLGPERCATLRRLAARLSSYINKEVTAAVDGPLESWSELAVAQQARGQAEVETALYRQGLLWRDLIRGERSPTDLELTCSRTAPSPADAWSDLKLYRQVVSSLKLPLIGGLISIILLAGGAALLAAGEGDKSLTTVLGIVGALGLTSASLYGRAKAEVTSLFESLSQAVRIARIRKSTDLCPPIGNPALTHGPPPLPPAAGSLPAPPQPAAVPATVEL